MEGFRAGAWWLPQPSYGSAAQSLMKPWMPPLPLLLWFQGLIWPNGSSDGHGHAARNQLDQLKMPPLQALNQGLSLYEECVLPLK